jgi:hypothetical protein
MKNTNKCLAMLRIAGIIALAAAIGFGAAGCKSADDGNTTGTTSTNTLVITGIPTDVDSVFSGVHDIDTVVLNTGTTVNWGRWYWDGNELDCVALNEDEFDVSPVPPAPGPYTVTVPLYTLAYKAWTGSGKFDVYIILEFDNGISVYKAPAITFTSKAKTTVAFSSFNKVYP